MHGLSLILTCHWFFSASGFGICRTLTVNYYFVSVVTSAPVPPPPVNIVVLERPSNALANKVYGEEGPAPKRPRGKCINVTISCHFLLYVIKELVYAFSCVFICLFHTPPTFQCVDYHQS